MVVPGRDPVWDLEIGLIAVSPWILKLQVTTLSCLGTEGICLTSMLCSHMSDGPLERGWFGDLIRHKLSKRRPDPGVWARVGAGCCLQPGEWQICGWETWAPSIELCAHLQAVMSPCFSVTSSVYPDSAKTVLLGLWMKGLQQVPFAFLASTIVSKGRKCMEGFRGWTLGWLLGSRTLEGPWRKAVGSFCLFTTVSILLLIPERSSCSHLLLGLGTLTSLFPSVLRRFLKFFCRYSMRHCKEINPLQSQPVAGTQHMAILFPLLALSTASAWWIHPQDGQPCHGCAFNRIII